MHGPMNVKFCLYFPFFLADFGGIRYIDDMCVMPLSSGEFRENQCSESHTLFRGVNEYMSVLSTFMYYLGGMQCNRTACNDVKHL